MVRRTVAADGQWIVVADAGPPYKTPSRWGDMVAAYRIHRHSTTRTPMAEGAVYLGDAMGINKAEYMAALDGLRLVADRMFVGEWSRDPVNVVTDNASVFNQAVGIWRADQLGWHLELLRHVEESIENLTGSLVTYWHAIHGENAGAHTLAANFPKVCDQRSRDEWERLRLQLRWAAVVQHLRDDRQLICATALSRATIQSYTGKTLTLAFRPSNAASRRLVAERRDVLREAVAAVMGQPLREIRCVGR